MLVKYWRNGIRPPWIHQRVPPWRLSYQHGLVVVTFQFNFSQCLPQTSEFIQSLEMLLGCYQPTTIDCPVGFGWFTMSFLLYGTACVAFCGELENLRRNKRDWQRNFHKNHEIKTTAFIFDTRKGVLVKVSKFLRQKMYRPDKISSFGLKYESRTELTSSWRISTFIIFSLLLGTGQFYPYPSRLIQFHWKTQRWRI